MKALTLVIPKNVMHFLLFSVVFLSISYAQNPSMGNEIRIVFVRLDRGDHCTVSLYSFDSVVPGYKPITWTGACKDQRADGAGILTYCFVYESDKCIVFVEKTGSMIHGVFDGIVKTRLLDQNRKVETEQPPKRYTMGCAPGLISGLRRIDELNKSWDCTPFALANGPSMSGEGSSGPNAAPGAMQKEKSPQFGGSATFKK